MIHIPMKVANVCTPPVFTASIQHDFSKYMHNLYIAEICRHRAVFFCW